MSKGIDVRATTSELLIREFLQDSAGAIVTAGTTSLYMYEVQMSDGTLKSYDFNDNTFKSTALTTETVSMTHRTGNNGGTNTGVWTYRLATLTGFTATNIYLIRIKNTGASPTDRVREIQWGGAEGDLTVTTALLDVNTKQVNGTAQTARDLGASVLLSAGTGTGQLDFTSGVVKANQTQLMGTALTESAGGRLKAAFTTFFDIASPVLTTASVNQTGDAYATWAIRSSTCQAGSTLTAVVLDAGASAINDIFKGCFLEVKVGANDWQSSPISAYNGSTKTATITALNATVGAPGAGDAFRIVLYPQQSSLADFWGYATRTLTAATNLTTSANVLSVDANGRVDVAKMQGTTLTARDIGASVLLSPGAGTGQVLLTAGAVTVGTNNDKTGYSIGASGLDAVLVESGISASVNFVNDSGSQLTSVNARQILAVIASSVAAVLAGAGTSNPTSKPLGKPAGSNRLSWTTDATGRTAVIVRVPD